MLPIQLQTHSMSELLVILDSPPMLRVSSDYAGIIKDMTYVLMTYFTAYYIISSLHNKLVAQLY